MPICARSASARTHRWSSLKRRTVTGSLSLFCFFCFGTARYLQSCASACQAPFRLADTHILNRTSGDLSLARMAAREVLRNIRDELQQVFLERAEVIDGALAALLGGHHVLIIGPPGTAKSMLADELCRRLAGATYFQWLLTKFTTPEELFGAVSLTALERDEYRRVTALKLPEAHIAFLDEVFKANSSILNAVLTLMNERHFHNGRQVE